MSEKAGETHTLFFKSAKRREPPLRQPAARSADSLRLGVRAAVSGAGKWESPGTDAVEGQKGRLSLGKTNKQTKKTPRLMAACTFKGFTHGAWLREGVYLALRDFLLPLGQQIQQIERTHFHTHLDFYWRICCTWKERAKNKYKIHFVFSPPSSVQQNQQTFDDILRTCAVCRFFGFARSTVSVHKRIQTCQFVSSFYVPSCELAHNRLVECVQLICPFV